MKQLVLYGIIILTVSVLLNACLSKENISPLPSDVFIKTYGAINDEEGFDVVELPDGGFVVVGSTTSSSEAHDIFVLRVDNEGNVMWNTVFVNPNEGLATSEIAKFVSYSNNILYIAGDSIVNREADSFSGWTFPFLFEMDLDGTRGNNALFSQLDTVKLSADNEEEEIFYRVVGLNIRQNEQPSLVEVITETNNDSTFVQRTGVPPNFVVRFLLFQNNLELDDATGFAVDNLQIARSLRIDNTTFVMGSKTQASSGRDAYVAYTFGENLNGNAYEVNGVQTINGIAKEFGVSLYYSIGTTNVGAVQNQILFNIVDGDDVSFTTTINALGGNNEQGEDVVRIGNELYVVGTRSISANNTDIIIYKINFDGEVLDSKLIGSPQNDLPRKVTTTSDGKLLIVGTLAGKMTLIKINTDLEFE